MNNEISELQRNLEKLMIEHEEATIGENRGRGKKNYWEKSDLYYQKREELRTLFTSLETELAALKAELEKYEWQKGLPNDDREILICVMNRYGNKFYKVNGWEGDGWEYGFDGRYLSWSEIRPYGGE